MAHLLSARVRQQLTRARHRASDGLDIASFLLYPLSSWSTQVHLPANTADHTNSELSSLSKRNAAIDLEIEQWTSLGSGGFVWNGSRRLAAYLHKFGDGQRALENGSATEQAQTAVASRPWGGLNVIELGAGTGMLGLAVAAMGANVTLTDQAAFVYPHSANSDRDTQRLQTRSLLDLLRANAKHNLSLTEQPGQQHVQVCEMLWGSASHHAALPHRTFDVIVAADILLFKSAHKDLLQTLHALSTPETVIFIQHTDRSDGQGDIYPEDMLHFLELMAHDNGSNALAGGGGLVWNPQVIHDYGRHITLRITCSQPPLPASMEMIGYHRSSSY